jgi:hypothetical protein
LSLVVFLAYSLLVSCLEPLWILSSFIIETCQYSVILLFVNLHFEVFIFLLFCYLLIYILKYLSWNFLWLFLSPFPSVLVFILVLLKIVLTILRSTFNYTVWV